MSETQRRYLSKNQFRELVKGAGKDAPLDTKDLCVLTPVATQVRAVGASDSRLIEFIVSTARVDRENDTIKPEGWDLTDFKSNPVVLWVHDHWSPPIAKAINIYLDGDALRSMAEFTPEDLNPFGFQVYRLYQGGYMNACSAGFQPLEYAYDEMRKYGINFLKQSLLEYSCVPVPANPDALAVARSKGLKTDLLKAWAERALDEQPSTDDARRQLEVLRNLSTSDGRALILEIGGMKMIGTKETPTAPPPTDKTASSTETVIKKVERWTCADGHEHLTEQEAKDCGNLETAVTTATDATKSLTTLLTARKAVTKQGRVLSAANEERIRSAVAALSDVLAQLEVVADNPEGDEGGDEGKDGSGVLMVMGSPEDVSGTKDMDEDGAVLHMSEEDLTKLVARATAEAVTAKFNELTGRVD